MMNSFFVTQYQDTKLDGGRDGLGLLPIWSAIARQGIFNITSISSDLGGWRSLLLCAWLAEQAVGTDDENAYRSTMLAAERLIGLARGYAPDEGLRSLERVRGSTRIQGLRGQKVSVAGSGRISILRGQRSTGFIGQIGRPAIRSGLLTEGLVLTDDARARVKEVFQVGSVQLKSQLRRWLVEGKAIDLGAPPPLFDAIARGAGPSPETATEARWWRSQVLCCERGTANGDSGSWSPLVQTSIVEALEALDDDVELHELPDQLRPRVKGPERANVRLWLDDINNVEVLIGRMEALFSWLRAYTAGPKSMSTVQEALVQQWDEEGAWGALPGSFTRALRILDERVPEQVVYFKSFADALQSLDPSGLISAVLRLNEAVTERRRRRPWVNCSGKLVAEITSQRPELGDGQRWEHSYYLRELRGLVRDCAPPAGGQ